MLENNDFFNIMGGQSELDPHRYWQGAQRVDAGNIANDPAHALKMRNQMYEYAVAIKKQRHESAIFAIERQSFFK